MVLHCPDDGAIGAPFYLMEFVDGTIYRSADQLRTVGPVLGRALADAQVDALVALHRTDPASVGLAELGRPEGYAERQVRRWRGQLEKSRSRDLPGLDELADRLAATVPEHGGAAIVHGDYRLDNAVIGDDTNRVVAILDWEMATLGDPLVDVAYMVPWWDGLAGLDSPVAAVPGEYPGFPGSTYLLERYARLTGTDVGRLNWYIAFAYFKIAAIFEGIHYRHQQELTVGNGFDRIGALVGPMVEQGHRSLEL
jgi:aminoglycoside phosphotransferase (APT) family kinase protein